MGISIMTNEDPEFYPVLGPFLANPTVAKVYGDHLWDLQGDIWAVARTSEGTVMGFATLRPRRQGRDLLLCNDFVKKEYLDDNNEVQTRLLGALLAYYQGRVTVTVVAAPSEKEYYEGKGFTQQGLKGSLPIMRKTIGDEEA